MTASNLDCRSCGACCVPERDADVFVYVDAADMLRMTPRYRQRVERFDEGVWTARHQANGREVGTVEGVPRGHLRGPARVARKANLVWDLRQPTNRVP